MYARYESGVTKPSADVLVLICRTFNISADYLLGLSDIPHELSGPMRIAAEPKTNYGEESKP